MRESIDAAILAAALKDAKQTILDLRHALRAIASLPRGHSASMVACDALHGKWHGLGQPEYDGSESWEYDS